MKWLMIGACICSSALWISCLYRLHFKGGQLGSVAGFVLGWLLATVSAIMAAARFYDPQ